MEWMEPDWEELDGKANGIIARYALVSTAWNILPPPLDVMGVTGTFAKMATELAGVYQVIVSASRARKMGWAIATATASVLGVTYAGSRLLRFIPGTGLLVSLLIQAPIAGAVSWAAGEALKDYFKQTRRGVEPGIGALRDSFARTLRFKLKSTPETNPDAVTNAATNGAAPAAKTEGVVEKIAGLHELYRQGALTQEEYEAKKAELLKQM